MDKLLRDPLQNHRHANARSSLERQSVVTNSHRTGRSSSKLPNMDGEMIRNECTARRTAKPEKKRHDPSVHRTATQVDPQTRKSSRTLLLERSQESAAVTASSRTSEIRHRFGVTQTTCETLLPRIEAPLAAGQIIAFVGPSGSGKSTALSEIESRFATAHNVDRISFPSSRAIIDCIAPQSSLSRALEILSFCALGEAGIWVKRFDALSEGEQFRARLARAIGAVLERDATGPLIIDEFGSRLHRRAAKAVAFNLRKLTTRWKPIVAIATNNEDILTDLQPDTIVRLDGWRKPSISLQVPRSRACSLWRSLRVTPATRRDYESFAPMHYRGTRELGFVSKVFALRERRTDLPVGVVVYSHGARELALRNQATDERFTRNLAKLNRELRVLRRLVMHPDLRGCGFGHRLVRKTLPLVGVPYVECLAAMGAVNPVFEKAGMKRIGECEAPRQQRRIAQKLAALGVDPFGPRFESQVCRRPKVRALVAESVQNWYEATTAEGKTRVLRQSPQLLARLFRNVVGCRPVYYLWRSPKAK